MTDALRQMVMNHDDAGVIAQAAVREGMRSMRQDGFAKAVAGITSIDEVLRVTQEIH